MSVLLLLWWSLSTSAKEVALTFDDAPKQRTDELIRKLAEVNVATVMVFANPCQDPNSLAQLKKYKDHGHLLANHTCSHFRLDDVGFATFSADAEKGDRLLQPLLEGQKFFRFPYLNEGKDPAVRDQMRAWLGQNHYRNGMISGDNEDPTFSAKLEEAKKRGKKINYKAVKRIFLEHVIDSLECNDALARQTLGRSPKHVLLLHEADATVMFIDALVSELRERGWQIISPLEAYGDPLYAEAPKNTYAGFGIVAQVAFEKTGQKKVCYDYKALVQRLNRALGLK